MTECFFADWPGAGPCDGQLIRAHLVPRGLLKREFPHGVVFEDGAWRRASVYGHADHPTRGLHALSWDPRCWVPCCGGPMGNAGHHGMLDVSRKLRIAREDLPPGVEEFAAELGLGWWLDRTYGAPVVDGEARAA